MPLRLRAAVCLIFVATVLVSPTLVRTQGPRSLEREYVEGKPAVSGEVLVRFNADNPAPTDLRAGADLDEDTAIGGVGWRRVHSRSRSVQALLLTLRSRPDVLQVEPNYIVDIVAVPNDPMFSSLWGLNNTTQPGADVHATSAWSVSTGSTANVVGVVDSGVDYTHPDLAANMWSAPTAFTVTVGGSSVSCPAGSHGFNAISFTCDPADDNQHGTHTSGTIGAVGNNAVGVVGVNWTTRIMGLKFLDSTGSGSMADAVNAIEFAIQAKNKFASSNGANVRVLSNSWGGPTPSSALDSEIGRANTANMLFVVAAGNSSTNNDASPFYPASSTQPNVVAVAATTSTDVLASFSNFGPTSVDLGAV